MTDASASSSTSGPSPLGALNPAFLERFFTGHVTGQPWARAVPIEATVAPYPTHPALPTDYVVVTINGFSDTATFHCRYEPRYHWNGTANVPASPPPKGTDCLVCFPTNNERGIGWALSFAGWPLE